MVDYFLSMPKALGSIWHCKIIFFIKVCCLIQEGTNCLIEELLFHVRLPSTTFDKKKDRGGGRERENIQANGNSCLELSGCRGRRIRCSRLTKTALTVTQGVGVWGWETWADRLLAQALFSLMFHCSNLTLRRTGNSSLCSSVTQASVTCVPLLSR